MIFIYRVTMKPTIAGHPHCTKRDDDEKFKILNITQCSIKPFYHTLVKRICEYVSHFLYKIK